MKNYIKIFAFASLSCLSVGLFVAQAQTGPKTSEGQLDIYLNEHPWTTAMLPYIEEYERQNNIDLKVKIFPESEYRDAVAASLAKGSNGVDVFMMNPQQEGNLYFNNDWLKNLAPLINDAKQTPSSWNFNDFYPTTVDSARFNNGIYGIPIQMETTMLFYRKDLFYKYGLAVPQTINQMINAARIISENENIAGIASRGKGASATSQFAPYLYGLGGNWTNSKGQVDFTQPAFIYALERYTEMLRKYGPNGITEMSWPEITQEFAAGKIAMFTDASVFRSIVADPKSSLVVGKIGYAAFPSGVGGQKPNVLTWTLALNDESKNTQAAWDFIKWASNKQNQLRVLLEDVPVPRQSAWLDPTFRHQDRNPDWTSIQLSQLDTANPQWNPPVIKVGEARDVLGEAIVSTLNGQNVEEALQQANTKLKAIIK